MAKKPNELLAESLQEAHAVANNGIVKATDLKRTDKDRLIRGGWLSLIIRGWYIFKQPTISTGESTRWYSSYWNFVGIYLNHRFGDHYCLTPDSSLEIHLGSTVIPKQLLIMVKRGGANKVTLPFNTSLLMYVETSTYPEEVEIVNGINVMPLELALYRISPLFYRNKPHLAEIALKMADQSILARHLLSGKNVESAARIIGAYEFLGEQTRYKQYLKDMKTAGYQLNVVNPFLLPKPQLQTGLRVTSPYAARIKILWQKMRPIIIKKFPQAPGLPRAKKAYFKEIDQLHVEDAYHSLSIEGYQVSTELIQQIANGNWQPEKNAEHKEQVNAMAAKGYHLAFLKVKESINALFSKENPGEIYKRDHHDWHSELFSPSVQAQIIPPESLAGYRNNQVYLRNSLHTPLPVHALTDAMHALFECLIAEEHASVRAILGHFIFVYIHPYMDGNGRLGRFLMNTMLASGGYHWTVIHVNNRAQYMKALEAASVEENIEPFTQFVLEENRRNDKPS